MLALQSLEVVPRDLEQHQAPLPSAAVQLQALEPVQEMLLLLVRRIVHLHLAIRAVLLHLVDSAIHLYLVRLVVHLGLEHQVTRLHLVRLVMPLGLEHQATRLHLVRLVAHPGLEHLAVHPHLVQQKMHLALAGVLLFHPIMLDPCLMVVAVSAWALLGSRSLDNAGA